MYEHGSFSVEWKSRILIVTLSGSFNEHGAEALTQHLREEIKKQRGKFFVKMVEGLNLEGFTPEAYAVLDQFNQWVNEQNLVAKALVYQNSVIPVLNRRHVPSSTVQNIKIFDDRILALEWLHDELTCWVMEKLHAFE